MSRPPRRHAAAFTLIEMITVIAIIAILAGLVLAVNGIVQKKSAMARADAEIRDLTVAIENYKTDNGGYPQDAKFTDQLFPMLNPLSVCNDSTTSTGTVAQSSLYLYKQLSGDTDGDGTIGNGSDTGKNYAPDFWKPSRLGGTKDATGKVSPVLYIMDPFGNAYGYSTAGLATEQTYRQQLATSPSASRPPAQGFNPTFDLFSCAGDTSGNTAKWVKNW